jgi:hypothetical protein
MLASGGDRTPNGSGSPSSGRWNTEAGGALRWIRPHSSNRVIMTVCIQTPVRDLVELAIRRARVAPSPVYG